MKLPAFGHSFNRRDLAVFGVETKKEARQNRLTVDQHGARAALAELASVLCSRQGKVLAQDFEECLMRRERDVALLAVESESYQSFLALCSSHPLVLASVSTRQPDVVEFEPQRLYQTVWKSYRLAGVP